MTANTIAVLGATGKTGSEIVKQLLAKDSFTANLHVYVRSQAKLLGLFPRLPLDPRVKVFEGPVTDTAVMTRCLSGVQTIICTIGENDNIPGIRVIQDAALSVIAALGTLSHSGHQWERPQLLLLSSSTWNARFAAARPAVVHWALRTAFHHPYADLVEAQSLLLKSPSLLNVLLIQPPALVSGEARGYEISTESVRLTVTYADLAAGFIEAATMEGYQELDAIGVSSQGHEGVLKYGPELMRRVVQGLLAQYVPGFWSIKGAISAIFRR